MCVCMYIYIFDNNSQIKRGHKFEEGLRVIGRRKGKGRNHEIIFWL